MIRGRDGVPNFYNKIKAARFTALILSLVRGYNEYKFVEHKKGKYKKKQE
jgi:hypothetical protein